MQKQDFSRRALTREPGIHNIAEEEGTACSRIAAAELGWSAAFRIGWSR